MTYNYSAITQRILDILQADTELSKIIAEFRFGDLPQIQDGTKFPLCFVTPAKSPEISRTAETPQADVDKLPAQRIKLEFWVVVLVTHQSLPSKVQRTLYDYTEMIQNIIARNKQLKNPKNNNDPLCITSETFVQGRLENKKGQLIEAMTIRVRPTIIVIID